MPIAIPLKLCDVTQFYAPRSGGVKRYLHQKSRFIAATEHEHVLIIPGAATNVRTEWRSSVYTVASPAVPRTGGYRILLNLRAVGEILAREQPDIIESADPYQLGWYTARAARMRRIPVVAFYHSHFCEAYVAPMAAAFTKPAECACRAYVRHLYNQFEMTFTASKALAETLLDWGVERVATVGLGVDTSVFDPRGDRVSRDSLGVAQDVRLLLYVGRLATDKNTAILCDAFAELSRRQPTSFHLLVIGDGPERARVEELSKTCRNVTWLEYCADPRQLARYYRTADLFVHPGVRETFGLAALEAQACGTPVVGIAGTRMDEAILHDQSWWAMENSSGALADAIERSRRFDLRTMGAAASRAVHERFDWERVFERLFCIYREVCTNYNRTRA